MRTGDAGEANRSRPLGSHRAMGCQPLVMTEGVLPWLPPVQENARHLRASTCQSHSNARPHPPKVRRASSLPVHALPRRTLASNPGHSCTRLLLDGRALHASGPPKTLQSCRLSGQHHEHAPVFPASQRPGQVVRYVITRRGDVSSTHPYDGTAVHP